MSTRKKVRGHLAWPNVDLRLRAMREIWVTMTRPDGGPHAVPVWFWWNGVSLYFTARAGTLKPRSLAAAPEIIVHNGDGVDPIIMEGAATLVTEPEELESVRAAYREKYVDPATGDPAVVDPSLDVVFRVAFKRVQAWAYANAATQTVWRLP